MRGGEARRREGVQESERRGGKAKGRGKEARARGVKVRGRRGEGGWRERW